MDGTLVNSNAVAKAAAMRVIGAGPRATAHAPTSDCSPRTWLNRRPGRTGIDPSHVALSSMRRCVEFGTDPRQPPGQGRSQPAIAS